MNKKNQKDLIANVLHLSRVLRRNRTNGSGSKKGHHGRSRVLRHLVEHEGITAAELSVKMDIRPASLSELIGILVEEGLVEKRPVATDKRKQGLHLTGKGEQLREQMSLERSESRKRIDEILTPEEQATFTELCEKLITGLQKGEDA